MRAVILAGGRGTRLAPYTAALPKPLVPIGGLPVLEIILRQLRQDGFTEVVLCVGHLARLIEAYFGNGEEVGLSITYSREDQPLGTAGPLALVEAGEEPILVMNADVLCTMDYGDLYRFHCLERGELTVSLYRHTVEVALGVLRTNDDGAIIGYREKPTLDVDVSMGIYVVSPSAHRSLIGNGRVDFPDLVNRLIAQRSRVMGYRFDGFWLDIGRPADYERACADAEALKTRLLGRTPLSSLRERARLMSATDDVELTGRAAAVDPHRGIGAVS